MKRKKKNNVLSFQIFSNLHTLSKYIDNFLKTCNNDIKQSIKDCFAGTDVAGFTAAKKGGTDKAIGNRGPGKASIALTTSQHFRAKLWTALEWLFEDEILSFCQQVTMCHIVCVCVCVTL